MSAPSDDPSAVARLLRSRLSGGPIDLPVDGGSMEGVIEAGSTVHLASADRPRRGEIWAFVDDAGRLTVHRVRHVDASTVTARGTGNPTDDPPVGHDRLVGRVHAAHGPGGARRFGRRDRLFAAMGLAVRHRVRRLVGPRRDPG